VHLVDALLAWAPLLGEHLFPTEPEAGVDAELRQVLEGMWWRLDAQAVDACWAEKVVLNEVRGAGAMASFALRQGVDLKTIQTMLRHSRLATTADLYTHVLHEVQRSGSDRIGDLLTEHGLGSVAASKP
jgi:site-specific recombinase XerD